MKPAHVCYSIRPSHPEAHLFEVRCTVREADPAGQRFALPAWIPGSYLIRDFARHVVAIRAESAGKPVALEKIDKHTWRAAPLGKAQALTVISEIYAWDLSVRGAHLDQTHAFFTAAASFCAPSVTNSGRAWSTSSDRWARRSRIGASPPRCHARSASGELPDSMALAFTGQPATTN